MNKVIPTALIILAIFWFSGQAYSANHTATMLGKYNILARHCAHVIEFTALFLCLRWSRLSLKTSIIFTALLAFLSECYQSFVPGRTASFFDVFLDLQGIIIGIGIMFLLRKGGIKWIKT